MMETDSRNWPKNTWRSFPNIPRMQPEIPVPKGKIQWNIDLGFSGCQIYTPLNIIGWNTKSEGLVTVQMIFPLQTGDFQVPNVNFRGCTLQGTNISPQKMPFWVDDFPFPQVGYVNSLEGIGINKNTSIASQHHLDTSPELCGLHHAPCSSGCTEAFPGAKKKSGREWSVPWLGIR